MGRCIRWEDDGITIEGENKYIDQMAEDWDMQKCSPVSSPGTFEDKREDGGETELTPEKAYKYRKAAAMGNYMSQDRPDIRFAAKEVSRGMAKPTERDVVKLKRLIRYLIHNKRRVLKYRWQDKTTRD